MGKMMKITQTLRKPANWQDFESLCLLLWRSEWKSEDIKKNGRNGQSQNGVDICGHRDGEGEYSGVQCKCKPGNNALTCDEIDFEIENARAFKPDLRRLVFATTADKDAAIEEYVRIKDEENRKQGLFSIDIKSWQDIVDMLERNKSVLNIYLDIVAEDYAVVIAFADGSEEMTIHPKYSRIHYVESRLSEPLHLRPVFEDELQHAAVVGTNPKLQPIATFVERYNPPIAAQFKVVKGHVYTNHAFCPLKFMIVNQGRTPIDDYKIMYTFDNEQVSFAWNNIEKKMMIPEILFDHGIRNLSLENGVGVTMYGDSLIPGDCAYTDDFFIRVPDGMEIVNIKWKLLSRHYSKEGALKLFVDKEYVEDVKYNREKAGRTEVSDYVEDRDIT